MTAPATYEQRRSEVETYFDRTAVEAWSRLTSDAPVGRIRATVRAGRDTMRATLLGWLPADLDGRSLLDAGCGTGALSIAAAGRGARVTAIDISPNLIRLAIERHAGETTAKDLAFVVGDMLDPGLGRFDHVAAMDSLIHYDAPHIVAALAGLAARTRHSIVFTFAPRTPALAAMHFTGRMFPRADRAPRIVPVAEATLRRAIAAAPGLSLWQVGRTLRVSRGFYTSQAMELVRR
jgi:magnesium-protoporphyrin O-methyltransferase